jgi:hypothetical protein
MHPTEKRSPSLPGQPVTLTPQQIEEMNEKLKKARHDVNNHLAVLVAGTELALRKPEAATRLLNGISDLPKKISEELQRFSVEFERTLGIRRE